MHSTDTQIEQVLDRKKIIGVAETILDNYDKKEAWNKTALVANVSVEIKKILTKAIKDYGDTVRDEETIICAAIKTGGNVVIRGHRHNDCIRTAYQIPTITSEQIKDRTEGFITSKNRFVNRVEALQIVLAYGQETRKELDPMVVKELFSEDLY